MLGILHTVREGLLFKVVGVDDTEGNLADFFNQLTHYLYTFIDINKLGPCMLCVCVCVCVCVWQRQRHIKETEREREREKSKCVWLPLTNLASSVPHGHRVIVRRGDSTTSRVCPTQLSTVILNILGCLRARQFHSCAFTKWAHMEALSWREKLHTKLYTYQVENVIVLSPWACWTKSCTSKKITWQENNPGDFQISFSFLSYSSIHHYREAISMLGLRWKPSKFLINT